MAAFHGLWSLAGFVGGIVGALFAAFPAAYATTVLRFYLAVMLVLFG